MAVGGNEGSDVGNFRWMVVPTGKRGLGYILHVTSIDNLTSIFRDGCLTADALLPKTYSVDELGSRRIKDQRLERPVPKAPGGVVGDYVPFYFSARSPMLYFAYMGNNPLCPFRKGQGELVHLVSHVQVIDQEGLPYVFTDRNAANWIADYSNDLRDLDRLVDWPLQQATIWRNTSDESDRMERRMAEFLVHERVPVGSLLGIATYDDVHAERVRDLLEPYDHPQVKSRPDWYY